MLDQKPKTILLVEDEAILAMGEEKLLRREGYDVLTASSGEDAIVLADSQHPDLILMDINLGRGIDGTQAAMEILKEHDIPVLFLSSHTEKEVVEKAEKITSYGYVVKNSTPTVLFASIKMAFRLYEANLAVRCANLSLESEISERRHMEERLRQATLAASIGVWDWDVVSNELVWDDSMYRLYGVSREDFIGAYQAFICCVHPDDVDRVNQDIQAALRGEKEYATEFRIVRPDGSVRFIQAASQTFRDPDGKPQRMIGTNIDVTERRRDEEALRDSQERYRLIFENSSTANSIFDMECCLVMQNSLSAQYLNMKRGDALGKNVVEIFGPTRGEQLMTRMRNVFASGISETVETQFNLPAGKKWFRTIYQPILNDAGMVQYVQIISQDITDLKQMEESLQESKHLFYALSENILTGVYIVQDGQLVYVNPALARTFGYEAHELMGTDLLVLIHPSDHESIKKHFHQSMSGEVDATLCEFHGIRKDGTTNCIAVLHFVAGINGCPAIMGNIMDVTDDKKG